MTVPKIVVGLFTVVGAVTCTVVAGVGIWYVVTRRPTPALSVREAVMSVRWRHGVGLFILPAVLVGLQEHGGVTGALLGAVIGAVIPVQLVIMQWWGGEL